MKEIPLTQDKVALVDGEDYEALSKHKWHLNNQGYASSWIDSQKVSMHRFILGLKKGDAKDVDHKNFNRLDNRRENIRVCTRTENSMNKRIQKNNLSSKFKGVSFDKDRKKFRSYISHKGRLMYLGLFTDEERAAKKYDQKATELYGQYAHLNFKNGE